MYHSIGFSRPFCGFSLSHPYQFVIPRAQAYLLAVLQAAAPLGVGGSVDEVVVAVHETRGSPGVREDRAGQGLGGEAGVGAGLVQGQGVEGGEHAQVGEYGRVVFAVAVAIGGDVDHEGDVEGGLPSTTALVYSAMRRFKRAAAAEFLKAMAP